MLATLDHGGGVLLGQLEVGARTNEIPLITKLLAPFDLTNVVPGRLLTHHELVADGHDVAEFYEVQHASRYRFGEPSIWSGPNRKSLTRKASGYESSTILPGGSIQPAAMGTDRDAPRAAAVLSLLQDSPAFFKPPSALPAGFCTCGIRHHHQCRHGDRWPAVRAGFLPECVPERPACGRKGF